MVIQSILFAALFVSVFFSSKFGFGVVKIYQPEKYFYEKTKRKSKSV